MVDIYDIENISAELANIERIYAVAICIGMLIRQ